MPDVYETLADKLFAAYKAEDKDSIELWRALMDAALDYTRMRNDWVLMTFEEKGAVDSLRTTKHDRWMDALTIYARYVGLDGLVLETLGNRQINRKAWGDFAAYLLLFGSLEAR